MAFQFGLNAEADGRWLALTRSILVNDARWLDQLLAAFPTPESLLNASASALSWHNDGTEIVRRSIEESRPVSLPDCLVGGSGLYLVTPNDSEYPALLAECADRPPFLFVRGDLKHLETTTLSIVGTRKPSLDGQRAAAEFSAGAADAAICVVSGLALGIDGIAHDAALRAGGTTIAVLPCGIDRIYPYRHRDLAKRVARGGALVSEFPLGTPPRKHHFHRRNRTLSGLSMATLVIEAGRPSGTLLTASSAADQGRDVLVLPWSIYHPTGAGCRYLLADGAMLMQSVEDLWAYLNVSPAAGLTDASLVWPSGSAGGKLPQLTPDQRLLLGLLGDSTHHADVLAGALKWELDRCLACLSALEVDGWVDKVAGGYRARQQPRTVH
jgi:DNA processing protein